MFSQTFCRKEFPNGGMTAYGTGYRSREDNAFDSGCNCADCNDSILCALKCYKYMMGSLSEVLNATKKKFEFPQKFCLHCARLFLHSIIRFALAQSRKETTLELQIMIEMWAYEATKSGNTVPQKKRKRANKEIEPVSSSKRSKPNKD